MNDFVIEVIIENHLGVAAQGVEKVLATAVRATLTHEHAQPPLELTVLLTDDEQIHQMNLEYRQEDKPTDVLSFPAGESSPGLVEEIPYLGDIAISVPYAGRQAAQAGHDLLGELQLLAVHGVLHLLGHDHDTAEGKEAMWGAQTAVLAQLNLQHITPTEN